MRIIAFFAFASVVLLAGGCSADSADPSPSVAISSSSSSSLESGVPQIEAAGGVLCDQPYALCNNAQCSLSPDDPDSVICRCSREDGWSIGAISCADRAPTGNRLISSFSPAAASITSSATPERTSHPSSRPMPRPIRRASQHPSPFLPPTRTSPSPWRTAMPWSRGAFAVSYPGQMTQWGTDGWYPEGRIHFAGEHVSPWPGWMEGALWSAERAVQEIL